MYYLYEVKVKDGQDGQDVLSHVSKIDASDVRAVSYNDFIEKYYGVDIESNEDYIVECGYVGDKTYIGRLIITEHLTEEDEFDDVKQSILFELDNYIMHETLN